MRKISTVLFVTCLFYVIASESSPNKNNKIVCYFTNWAVQRPSLGSMLPEHIDPCLCTHIIYGFSDLKDNKLYPMEKYDHSDNEKIGFFERINSLKQKNPKLRTLLAVGGWEMGMDAFTNMVKDDKNIEKFVQTSIEYLRKWDFDGLDLDFEYPGIDWRGSPPTDKMAFTKLCQMLREGFEKESKESGKERLLLTAAVAGAKNTIDKAYEVDKVSEHIDWWNLMTYDLHGPWDTNSGHHSAINGKDSQDYLYIDYIVKYYESKGAPRSKLVLGLASYGRSDAPAMPYTGFKGESGFLSYYEACLMLTCESWKEFWNEPQLVPYAKGKDNYPWAGYDNVKSMKIKAEYILKENLAGAMFWTIDLDDFTGKFCCQGHFPLIRTVKSILENEPKFMPSDKMCDACPNTEYKSLKKKSYRKKREINAEEVCKEKGEGLFADHEDCTKYFVCRNLNVAWGEKKREACYTGSYFDPKAGQCKWVGEGNFNCDEILEKTPSNNNNNNNNKTATTTNKSKNRQRIFYEKDGVPNKAIEETIIPASSYTCPADFADANQLAKCFSCESDAKSLHKCKNSPSGSSQVIRCQTKSKKCFSKAVYDSKENLVSFQRGCATLNEMQGESFLESNLTSDCVKSSNGTKTCFVYCAANLCNTVAEIKWTNNNAQTGLKCWFILNFILVAFTGVFSSIQNFGIF